MRVYAIQLKHFTFDQPRQESCPNGAAAVGPSVVIPPSISSSHVHTLLIYHGRRKYGVGSGEGAIGQLTLRPWSDLPLFLV